MAGYVYVQAASARVLVPVPFGWRGFDDGKRTRLFTPAGNIGIVINATQMDADQTWDETREQVWKYARQTAAERSKKDPRYSARLIRLADGTFGMREANIYESEDDPYSSVVLFRQHPNDPRTVLRVNLFAPIGDFDRHLGTGRTGDERYAGRADTSTRARYRLVETSAVSGAIGSSGGLLRVWSWFGQLRR